MSVKKTHGMGDAIATARGDLDQIRDRIGDLQSQLKDVQRAPVDLDEATRRVDAIISQARAIGVLNRPEIFTADGGRLGEYFGDTLRSNPLAALAAVCPDLLARAFLAHHPNPTAGLSTDARLARLADLEAALLASEAAEEMTLREIESATSASLPRRLDARPEILLAPTHELGG